MPDIRPIQPKDFGRAVEILVSSFLADPFQMGLLPEDGKQAKRLERYFSNLLGKALSPGSPYLAEVAALDDPNIADAVALWLRPDFRTRAPEQKTNLMQRFRSIAEYPQVFGVTSIRAFRADRSCMKALPTFPVWYLNYLGTHPTSQGRGAGSALIRHRIAAADTEGVPCYLESSSKENVAYYERFGFEVQQELPNFSVVPLTTMLKQPAG